MLIVVIGVSGSGKSSVASSLARRCGFLYLDADDYHTPASRELMRRGIALTEEQRKPWILSLCADLRKLALAGRSCVLAFPGLRKIHRDYLRASSPRIVFFFLEGEAGVIRRRLERRRAHFMSPSLLDSQFQTLERPADEADVHALDVRLGLEDVVDEAMLVLRGLGLAGDGDAPPA